VAGDAEPAAVVGFDSESLSAEGPGAAAPGEELAEELIPTREDFLPREKPIAKKTAHTSTIMKNSTSIRPVPSVISVSSCVARIRPIVRAAARF